MKKFIVSLFTLTLFTVNVMAQECDVPSTVTATVRLVRKPNTLLRGQFSVAGNRKVSFSKGNLQYTASTGTWQFATNQYDYIGNAAGNTTASGRDTQSDKIDLFGYGTSGNDSKFPYQASSEASDYASGGIAETANDWGINFSGEVGTYRVLTSAEWHYLLNERTNYSELRLLATVHSVPGLVLLPDEWTNPGATYTVSTASFTNTITDADWTKMENAGAVFLPAAGQRSGTTVSTVGTAGYYWTGTDKTCTYFVAGSVSASTTLNYYIGASVRLVQTL